MSDFNASDDAHHWFNNTGGDPPYGEGYLSEVFHERWSVWFWENAPEELGIPSRFFAGDPEDGELNEDLHNEIQEWFIGHPEYHKDCMEFISCVQEIQEEVRFFQEDCGGDWYSYYGVSRSDFA